MCSIILTGVGARVVVGIGAVIVKDFRVKSKISVTKIIAFTALYFKFALTVRRVTVDWVLWRQQIRSIITPADTKETRTKKL